jgi:starvation-inducible DNA-binding protein
MGRRCRNHSACRLPGLAATFPASDPPSVTQPLRDTKVVHHSQEGEAMNIHIGLSDQQRETAISILNTLLADEFVLYAKSRRFHWNVEGLNFSELHNLFEKQYEQLGQFIDEIAERVRALDGIATGSLQQYLELTRLMEQGDQRFDANGMIAALLDDHESLIRFLREDLKSCSNEQADEGTMDLLIRLMQDHEKMAWMLRAYLQ